jgi:hypothetical protein
MVLALKLFHVNLGMTVKLTYVSLGEQEKITVHLATQELVTTFVVILQ